MEIYEKHLIPTVFVGKGWEQRRVLRKDASEIILEGWDLSASLFKQGKIKGPG